MRKVFDARLHRVAVQCLSKSHFALDAVVKQLQRQVSNVVRLGRRLFDEDGDEPAEDYLVDAGADGGVT